MPLQIYMKKVTKIDAIQITYINVVTLCPCHKPLRAQVAQSSGCSNTFGRVDGYWSHFSSDRNGTDCETNRKDYIVMLE